MEQPDRRDAGERKGFRIPLGLGIVLVVTITALAMICVGCFVGPVLTTILGGGATGAASREEADAAWEAYLASAPAPEIERVFTVAVFADEEFRRRADSGADWRAAARTLIDDASEIFERECELGLAVVTVGEWESRAAAPDLFALYADARALVRPEPDLFVVFVGQAGPTGSFEEYVRGYAPYFGRLALVRPNVPGETWFYERETVAHEIGHLFGAWHSLVEGSLMRTDKRGPECFSFDPRSRDVIDRIAELDIALGPEALDAAAEQDLNALYVGDHFCFDEHPLAYELIRRAHERMLRKDDPKLIRADLERGLAISGRWPSRWNQRTRDREDAVRAYLDD